MKFVDDHKLKTKNSKDYFRILMGLFIEHGYEFKISSVDIYQDEINYLFHINLFTGVNSGDDHKGFFKKIKIFTDIADGIVQYSNTETLIKITADKKPLEAVTSYFNVNKSISSISKFNL